VEFDFCHSCSAFAGRLWHWHWPWPFGPLRRERGLDVKQIENYHAGDD
jgi:hypothetical protein